MTALKVGLLGGSFNPAHEGHHYISKVALRLLGLDQVWWLVSPQNPLKPTGGMAEYEDRLDSARKAARDPRIRISDFEKKRGEVYTAKTIAALKIRYPDHQFVWLMGADNLVQFPTWHQWERILQMVPVAVFNRPGYTYQALNGKAAYKYRRARLKGSHGAQFLRQLAEKQAPCWAFVAETTHKLSSTTLRNFHDNAGNACS